VRILLVVIITALFSGSLQAEVRSSTRIRRPKIKKQVEKRSYSFPLSYSYSSDFNQHQEPRLASHQAGLGVNFALPQKYTLEVGTSFQYSTVGKSVVRTSNKEDYFSMNDISLSLYRPFTINPIHSLTAGLGTDLLTSDESRYAGYRGVGSAFTALSSKIFRYTTLKNSLFYSYILNRYKYAPVSAGGVKKGEINSDHLLKYTLGASIKIYKSLTFGDFVQVVAVHYLDNTSTYNFGNNYKLSYASGNWSVFANYINRGYADRGETNLWFVDRYKQLWQLGVAIEI
jgi:hypothetical protein